MATSLSIVAIVTAGWTQDEADPLVQYSHTQQKALIPIAGKPMIVHVVEALAASRHVKHIVVVALAPDVGVEFPVPVEYLPDAGGLFANTEAGLEYARTHYPGLDAVFLSSSDVPTITPQIVDGFIDECFSSDHDLYYPVVERKTMESRFPGSRRSYVHLREGDFAGGDIILIRPSLVVNNRELVDKIAHARKSALRQARMLGLWTFCKLLTHRLSFADAEKRVHQVLNIRGRVMSFPYAEAAMDVDKPVQLDIVRADVEARSVNATDSQST